MMALGKERGTMGLKIFLNGELVEKDEAKISVFDHGLLYGDGVFEGIRSYNRKIFRLDAHIDRLYASAEKIKLEIPTSKSSFKRSIVETLKVNGLDNAYIRAVFTRGVGDLGLDPRKCPRATMFIITDKIKLYPEDFYINGLPLITAKTRRNHPSALDPRIKSLNYLNNILAKIEAIAAGTDEALMLTVDGKVAECTGDNVFIVKNGELSSPPPDLGALEGITQRAVIDLAGKKNLPFVFREMQLEDIYDAEECFLTGTAAEIVPVVSLDGKTIGDGRPGKVTKLLLGDFRELTKTDGVAY